MQEHSPLQPLSDSQRETLEEAVTSFQSAVTRTVAGYLMRRGIGRNLAATYRLGVVGSNPPPGFGRYEGMLAIPYLHHEGYPLTVRFRCLEEHDHRNFGHGKYMSMPDDPVRMFNAGAVKVAGDEIHVTEGELDAIILSSIGLPAVAIPGAHLWRRHHRRVLAGFSRVWVWGDPDDAGAEFTNKLTSSLRQAKPVPLREGDVNDTYLEGGAEALLALIEKGG